MTYRQIQNTVWKYPLIAIAIIIALSIMTGLFLYFNTNKTYDSRRACQNAGDCECEPTWSGTDKATYPETWECVRPLPSVCIFNPDSDRKSIRSVRLVESMKGAETISNFDLCAGELSNNDEIKKLDTSKIKELATILNQTDYLHLKERVFSDPGYDGQEYIITVEYQAEVGANTLETFSRTASCSTACSEELNNIINVLKTNIN